MTHHKSEDYKERAVQYYLVEDKSQEEVCKIFECSCININYFRIIIFISVYYFCVINKLFGCFLFHFGNILLHINTKNILYQFYII